MVRPSRAAALALAWVPALAAGAVYDGSQSLDAYTGVVVSSGRVVGLGGAFVGVGEGVGGATVNPAAVAQRDRHAGDAWALDGIFTWYVPRPDQLGGLDLANDGSPDGGLGLSEVLLAGGGLQLGRLGAGVLAQVWTVGVDRSATERVTLSTADVSFAAGWCGWRDALAVGGSATIALGSIGVGPPGSPSRTTLGYTDTVLRVGALWRPRGERFRIGVAWRPPSRATPDGDRSAFPVTTPASFLSPWLVSLGASAWFGPNAGLYNEPPPVERRLHPEWGTGPGWETSRKMPVLLSVQLDLVGPTRGAVSMESALLAPAEAQPSGEKPSMVPRAGVEWEAWPRWARIRGGSYLEPSRTGASPRLHGTFGAEARVPFWPWDLQVGLAGDVASLYQNVSLSIGFWGDYGPSTARRAAL
jgi:hypothetical protein